MSCNRNPRKGGRLNFRSYLRSLEHSFSRSLSRSTECRDGQAHLFSAAPPALLPRTPVSHATPAAGRRESTQPARHSVILGPGFSSRSDSALLLPATRFWAAARRHSDCPPLDSDRTPRGLVRKIQFRLV